MGIVTDRLCLELSLKEGADSGKALIDGFGVGDQELLHGEGYVGRDIGRLTDFRRLLYSAKNMIMRRH
jgi:hypothetical protein